MILILHRKASIRENEFACDIYRKVVKSPALICLDYPSKDKKEMIKLRDIENIYSTESN